jgi:hypothetical protein
MYSLSYIKIKDKTKYFLNAECAKMLYDFKKLCLKSSSSFIFCFLF